MDIGLTKKQIKDALNEVGVNEETEITAEILIEAIFAALVENNKLIRQGTTDNVIKDIERKLSSL